MCLGLAKYEMHVPIITSCTLLECWKAVCEMINNQLFSFLLDSVNRLSKAFSQWHNLIGPASGVLISPPFLSLLHPSLFPSFLSSFLPALFFTRSVSPASLSFYCAQFDPEFLLLLKLLLYIFQSGYTLAVINIGAPAGGMSTAVRSFVRFSLYQGHSVLGIRDGINGLLDNRVIN